MSVLMAAGRRVRFAAALRRHAHELECRRDRTVRTVWADTHERLSADADRLRDRAEQVSR